MVLITKRERQTTKKKTVNKFENYYPKKAKAMSLNFISRIAVKTNNSYGLKNEKKTKKKNADEDKFRFY